MLHIKISQYNNTSVTSLGYDIYCNMVGVSYSLAVSVVQPAISQGLSIRSDTQPAVPYVHDKTETLITAILRN